MAESFFATLELELMEGMIHPVREAAKKPSSNTSKSDNLSVKPGAFHSDPCFNPPG